MDNTDLNDLLEDLPLPADMFVDVDLDIPDATPEEMALIAHLLPPGFGQPRVMPNPTPSESSLTAHTQKISIRVNRYVIDYLRKESFRRGLGYQTFANMILHAAATGQNF